MRNALPIKIILLVILAFTVALIAVSLSRGLSANADGQEHLSPYGKAMFKNQKDGGK